MAKQSQPQDQFSDDEMSQMKRYGQALGGGVTPFDEEVEKELQKQEHEASHGKMQAALTGGSLELGPSDIDTAAVKQRGALEKQATTAGAKQAQAGQSQMTPPNAPEAPAGPVGTSAPYPAQKGAVGPQETPQTPASSGAQAAAETPPPAPGGPPPGP